METQDASLGEPELHVRDDRFNGKVCKFQGLDDRKEGSLDWFGVRVHEMLESFRQADPAVRGVWVELPGNFFHGASWLCHSQGFRVHHATTKAIMLNKWLPDERYDPDLMPSFAHTYVGVGAIVLRRAGGLPGAIANPEEAEVLGITERWAFDTKHRPKFPGGYVDANERLVDAVQREVREEIGITVRFRRIVAFKQSTTFLHGCSDMYFACLCEQIDVAEPLTIDPVEIATARWIPVREFLASEDVFTMNKELLRAAIADITESSTAGSALIQATSCQTVSTEAKQTVPSMGEAHSTAIPVTPSMSIPGITDVAKWDSGNLGQGMECCPRVVRLPGSRSSFEYDLYLPGACKMALESPRAATSAVAAEAVAVPLSAVTPCKATNPEAVPLRETGPTCSANAWVAGFTVGAVSTAAVGLLALWACGVGTCRMD